MSDRRSAEDLDTRLRPRPIGTTRLRLSVQASTKASADRHILALRGLCAWVRSGRVGATLTKATASADLNVFNTLASLARVDTETYPAGWRGRGTRVARVPYTEVKQSHRQVSAEEMNAVTS